MKRQQVKYRAVGKITYNKEELLELLNQNITITQEFKELIADHQDTFSLTSIAPENSNKNSQLDPNINPFFERVHDMVNRKPNQNNGFRSNKIMEKSTNNNSNQDRGQYSKNINNQNSKFAGFTKGVTNTVQENPKNKDVIYKENVFLSFGGNPKDRQWFFQNPEDTDPSKQDKSIQGPFDSIFMFQFLQNGKFDIENTRIAFQTTDKFIRLKKIIPKDLQQKPVVDQRMKLMEEENKLLKQQLVQTRTEQMEKERVLRDKEYQIKLYEIQQQKEKELQQKIEQQKQEQLMKERERQLEEQRQRELLEQQRQKQNEEEENERRRKQQEQEQEQERQKQQLLRQKEEQQQQQQQLQKKQQQELQAVQNQNKKKNNQKKPKQKQEKDSEEQEEEDDEFPAMGQLLSKAKVYKGVQKNQKKPNANQLATTLNNYKQNQKQNQQSESESDEEKGDWNKIPSKMLDQKQIPKNLTRKEKRRLKALQKDIEDSSEEKEEQEEQNVSKVQQEQRQEKQDASNPIQKNNKKEEKKIQQQQQGEDDFPDLAAANKNNKQKEIVFQPWGQPTNRRKIETVSLNANKQNSKPNFQSEDDFPTL